MALELEQKPRVTEIQVRMDCNGCVQKLKKALQGINGIYDLYIDIPQQKLTVVGWADPQKIVKAIRKTRKTAIICSHSEPSSDPPEQPPDGGESPPEESNPHPSPEADAPPPEPSPLPQTEPPTEPSPPPPPENPQNPSPSPSPPQEPEPNPSSQQPPQPPPPAGSNPQGQKDVGEVHVIYHHPPSDYRYHPPPDYGYRYGYGGGSPSRSSSYHHPWNRYHDEGTGYPPVVTRPPPPHQPPPPPPPVYVAHHNYMYRPAPYVTEYEYDRSTQPPPQPRYMQPPPPPSRYTHYSRMDYYNEEYHDGNHRGNGNISSMFSDENPNACTVM